MIFHITDKNITSVVHLLLILSVNVDYCFSDFEIYQLLHMTEYNSLGEIKTILWDLNAMNKFSYSPRMFSIQIGEQKVFLRKFVPEMCDFCMRFVAVSLQAC